ncbi:MAG TPA: hypothetical protein VIV57_21470 [Anaeromyxobacter sp.]
MRVPATALLAVLLASACREEPDLSRGGVELVYLARLPAEMQGPQRAHALGETRSRVARRLQALRIPAVVTSEAGRIRVALPSGTSSSAIQAVKSLMPVRAHLELREVDDEALVALARNQLLWPNVSPSVKLARYLPEVSEPSDSALQAPSREAAAEAIRTLSPGVPAGRVLALEAPEGEGKPWKVLMLGPAFLDNDAIADARAVMGERMPAVLLEVRRDAAGRFEEVSRRLVGRRLAITLDGAILTAPYVTAPITGGRVQITLGASGTVEGAKLLATQLSMGPLPYPLALEAERAIPPSRP